jgi:hypothetical protein
MARKRDGELFYVEKGKPRQDAELHDAIFADADEKTALTVSQKVGKRLGLTAAEDAALMRPKKKK